ncbi:MAG: hypothetical protein ABI716_02675 [Candidatus Saccharibacteria bacterium]
MLKILTKNNAIIALLILIIAQFGLSGYLYKQQNNVNSLYKQELDTMQQNITSANSGLSYQQVTVSPIDNKIYLPQLNLALPMSTLGQSLLYSANAAYVTGSYKIPTGPADEASISVFGTASAPQSQSQFDCSGLVHIKFEAQPNPYNPSDVPQGSVVLKNGKTLQIYASHRKNCQPEWSVTQANADAIAALFKQAESY